MANITITAVWYIFTQQELVQHKNFEFFSVQTQKWNFCSVCSSSAASLQPLWPCQNQNLNALAMGEALEVMEEASEAMEVDLEEDLEDTEVDLVVREVSDMDADEHART